MKLFFTVSMFVVLLIFSVSCASDNKTENNQIDSSKVTTAQPVENSQIVVYYFHSNQRCMTCRKLESFSEEAIISAYENKLKDSSVVWRVVNFEEENNEHYAKDYKLYTQSLILSKIQDGKEIKWKNLDKIWKLVGDKKEYISYVQNEIKLFMNPENK